MAITDASGIVVVEYTYDTWGKLLSITGSMADTIGIINPIRYRGYYYDSETGFYFLQTRYYDPDTGRFINADGILDEGTGFAMTNMFAYCGNDPVNKVDPTGMCALDEFRSLSSFGGSYYWWCPVKDMQNRLNSGPKINIPKVEPQPKTGVGGFGTIMTNLGKGYSARVERHADGVKHVHVERRNVEFANQREDNGKPRHPNDHKHDPNDYVKSQLKEKLRWDWDENAAKANTKEFHSSLDDQYQMFRKIFGGQNHSAGAGMPYGPIPAPALPSIPVSPGVPIFAW